MTERLDVRHLDGDRFAIDVRGHTITVDQPVDAGGEDTARTLTELFVAGAGELRRVLRTALPGPPRDLVRRVGCVTEL